MASNHPLTGPIPGENYTSDTKNYPWHRPPEFTDLDKAIDAIGKKLMSTESAPGLLTMIESGFTLAQLTTMFVISGIGAGKWTPDFALLLAGPVSHIMLLMCQAYGIKCELGIDSTVHQPTKLFFDAIKPISDKKVSKLDQQVDLTEIKKIVAANKGGFMGATPPQPASGVPSAPALQPTASSPVAPAPVAPQTTQPPVGGM